MEIIYTKSYDTLSEKAAELIAKEIKRTRNLLLCAATGSSPTGLYAKLANDHAAVLKKATSLRVIKLDEWGGISMRDPATCEFYLQKNVIRPFKITKDRYIAFNSMAKEPEKECSRISKALKRTGPIDICVLGIGKNGHIALNEPAKTLQSECHVAKLSKQSLKHSMLSCIKGGPAYGLTLGMGDIMRSKMIVLLITGSNKKNVIKKFLEGKIAGSLPASFLWLHANVYCFIDNTALN